MAHLVWFLFMVAVAIYDYWLWKQDNKPYHLVLCGMVTMVALLDLSTLIKQLT